LNREGQVVSVAPAPRAAEPTPPAIVTLLQEMTTKEAKAPVARVTHDDLVLMVPVLGLVGDTAGILAMKTPRSSLSARAEALAGEGSQVQVLLAEALPATNPEEIAAAAPLRLAGLTQEQASRYEVRVTEPAAQRFLPVRELTIRLSLGVAALVAVFALIGWFAATRLTAPLEKMTRLVKEVAAGRYLTKAPEVPFQELDSFAETLAGLGQAVTAQMQTIREQEQVKGELERTQVQAELNAMRSQMNPHFLFNSLNSVSTMASIDPEKAQTMISRLADLYRGILDSSKTATSPLSHEIEIASNYLELEKMRFGDRLTYGISAPEGLGDVYSPGLLLQTLVENAVKHGIAPSRQGGRVDVTIEAKGGGLYRMTVRNSGQAFNGRRESAEGGTGLANTVRRLDLLYGTRHEFMLEQDASGDTVATFLFTGERK
jgi:sensor histidine kinase YesM